MNKFDQRQEKKSGGNIVAVFKIQLEVDYSRFEQMTRIKEQDGERKQRNLLAL